MKVAAVAQTVERRARGGPPQVSIAQTNPDNARSIRASRFAFGRISRGRWTLLVCDVMKYFDDQAIVRDHKRGLIP